MSAFIQGLKFGALTGLLNNMFGNCCCSFNPVTSWRFTPQFFTPTFGVGLFNSYHNLDYNLPTFCNFSPPASIFTQQNYAWENFTPQPLNFYNMQNSWNGFGYFDTFKVQEPIKPAVVNGTQNIEQKKQEEVIASYDAQELKDKWNKYKPNGTKHLPIEFFEKVISISKELDCDPNDLMGVFNLETMGTFKASVQNKNTKATGLIQFMRKTAEDYGTSIEKLAKMTEVEQLDYVRRYLLDKKKISKIKGRVDATTLYCFVFWPDAANKDNSFVIATKKNSPKTYGWNECLDFNNDKIITRGDLANNIQQFIA